jgi:hypothetical protein
MHILLSPKFSGQAEMIDYAEQLSISFVTHFGQVYGQDNLVYNVHSVVHLANDVRMFGNLDNISSFPFENYLGCIKRFVRKPALPLQQLVRRLSEQCDKKVQQAEGDLLKKLHNSGPVPVQFFGANQYKEICRGNSVLSVEPGDNCITVNEHAACIQNILGIGSQTVIVYRPFHTEESLFTYPCDSALLGIKVVSDLDVSCSTCPLSSVTSKCVMLPYFGDSQYVVLPMLHTNN